MAFIHHGIKHISINYGKKTIEKCLKKMLPPVKENYKSPYQDSGKKSRINLFDNQRHWKHYNAEALTAALRLVMQNNIFRFGNSWFKQKTGTAMGTPPAPPWATIFYFLHEDILLDGF